MVIMIILLILCLPLILMLSLFTTTNVVSIVVDVPVTGIEISVEDVIELDLDKGESFVVDYIVTPTEASKKDVKFLFLPVGNEKLASFTQEGNRIIPTSYGTAMVTVETLDGGFRDAFQIVVHSKMVESIDSKPEKDTILVGEKTKISTKYFPEIINDPGLTYRVKEGEGIVTVSSRGEITGIGIGTAIIEVTSTSNPEAKCEFAVTVESSGVIDFVSDTSTLTALDNTGKINAILNPDITVDSYSVTLYKLFEDGSKELLDGSVVSVTLDTLTGEISYEFIDKAFVGNIEIELTVTPTGAEAVTKSCYIERISKISIEWVEKDEGGRRYSVHFSDSNGEPIQIDLKPLGADVSYHVTLSYTKMTDVTGELEPGTEFDLEEGVVYTANGGYLSLELESSSDGVYLVVRGEYEPTLEEIGNDSALTYITLRVHNNHNNEDTVLGVISVVVY